jgi:hypothetical protein
VFCVRLAFNPAVKGMLRDKVAEPIREAGYATCQSVFFARSYLAYYASTAQICRKDQIALEIAERVQCSVLLVQRRFVYLAGITNKARR